ncbi:hypothetical protein EON78_01965 [bacterium]|nr:MAG: hypothetical protein EON78_01965 [bacterium]
MNNTMHLLEERLYDGVSTYSHYINTYNKFQNVKAVRYDDENDMFDKIRLKVLNGEAFAFACDSKEVVTSWYNELYFEASVETQKRMVLFTKDTDGKLCKDWQDKMIFYSPKISTGVDITRLEQTEQFVYITGNSVLSITLYQMATRTRNMKQLNYFSCAKSHDAEYLNIKDCDNKITSEFNANVIGLSQHFKDTCTKEEHGVEASFRKIYTENTYLHDYYNTSITKFFEDELTNAGFIIIKSNKKMTRLNDEIKEKMNTMKLEISEQKYELLVNSTIGKEEMTSDEEDEDVECVKEMKKRVDILGLNTRELLVEYKDLIQDEYKFESFMNYNRLHKSFEYCEKKVDEITENKMITGIQSNVWFKVKYIHMLAKVCGIEGDLFNFEKMTCPDLRSKKVYKLILAIKTLYRKRDTVEYEDYDLDKIMKLYKFMIDGLIKKLGIIKSTKSKSKESRDQYIYSIDEDKAERFNKLVTAMNPIATYLIEEDEEE